VAWVRSHRRAVGIAAVAVVAAAFTIWFTSVSAARRERAAQVALEGAWSLLQEGQVPQAATELQRIIQGFGGTRAGLQARLTLNHTRILSAQNQLAVEDLRAFIGTNPPARFRAQAGMLLGTALENMNQHQAAAAAYVAAAEAAELEFEKADALVAAARAYRNAGRPDQALEVLKRVVEQYPETAGAAVARVRLGELLGNSGP
jgi:tetratricopeptide (TPR) repeat protein